MSVHTHTHFKRTSSLHLQSIVFPKSTKILPHVSAARKLHTDNMLFPHCLSHNLRIFPQEENTVLYCVVFLRSRCTKGRTMLYVRALRGAVCDRDNAGSTGEGARGKEQIGSTEPEYRCPYSAFLVPLYITGDSTSLETVLVNCLIKSKHSFLCCINIYLHIFHKEWRCWDAYMIYAQCGSITNMMIYNRF